MSNDLLHNDLIAGPTLPDVVRLAPSKGEASLSMVLRQRASSLERIQTHEATGFSPVWNVDRWRGTTGASAIVPCSRPSSRGPIYGSDSLEEYLIRFVLIITLSLTLHSLAVLRTPSSHILFLSNNTQGRTSSYSSQSLKHPRSQR